MPLRAPVGIMSLRAALKAGDFLQGLVHHALQAGALRVLVLVGRLDVAERSVPGFFLALGCFALLWRYLITR